MSNWSEVDRREGETFEARLVRSSRNNAVGIVIYRPNTVATFVGVAVFPEALQKEAVRRYRQLETDIDIEDLLREWGSEEDYDDFERFIAEESTGEP